MIDRIVIYINGVDFDDIEKRIGLEPTGEARDGSAIYSSKLNNIKFRYAGERLQINGSLHKFIKGNNYGLFTYNESKDALIHLSEYVGIALDRFVVSQIELGLNFSLSNKIERYLEIIHSYKNHSFNYMAPLKGTSKLKGCKCIMAEYTIKFYDKTFETIKTERIPKSKWDSIPSNILRYEIVLSRKQLKYEGFTNVTGKNLLSPLHYIRFKRLMNRILSKILFKDFSINYSLLEADKVKNYIFAMSNTYDQYLRYLKDYKGEEEYRKEKRRTNELLKKIAPLKKGKFEAELKSEFKLALSKI
jgi:hypothetical protein